MWNKRTLLAAAAVIAALCALLTGCSRGSSGQIFRYDIEGPVENLDPQFATDATARMIIANIYEGLLVSSPEGELRPGVATGYSVSSDGLSYRFELREAYWSDGSELTAADFVFGLRRLFDEDALSPWAKDYQHIRGAKAIMERRLSPEALGVTALDERTLLIDLEQPDPLFLQRLAEPAAMPCREEFFLESLGRYGLRNHLLSNGPFAVSAWNNETYLSLRVNEHYVSDQPVKAGGVNLYVGRGDRAQQFLAGNSDLAQLSLAQYEGQPSQNAWPYEKLTWCIVFNQNDPVWGNALLRQSLFYAVDYAALRKEVPQGLAVGNLFVPPAIRVGSRSYRQLAGDVSPVEFDIDRALYLLEIGMQGMEMADQPSGVMYVPDTGGHSTYMSLVRKGWRNDLSVTVDFEPLPTAEIEERLRSGSYQMLLLPFSSADGTPDSLLGVFSTQSGQNYFGYHSPLFDQALLEAPRQSTLEGMARKYGEAEWNLLSDGVVIPVYTETVYYTASPDIAGLEVYPYGEKVYFKYAVRE